MSGGFRSGCPIATTLDIVGDKWTLVIIRDLINGKARYSEFLESPEKITTNILASRLSHMVEVGLLDKQPYQDRPTRYAYNLTKKGRDLHPILLAICRWGNVHFPESWVPPASFMELDDNEAETFSRKSQNNI